jgi:hypothetical protein
MIKYLKWPPCSSPLSLCSTARTREQTIQSDLRLFDTQLWLTEGTRKKWTRKKPENDPKTTRKPERPLKAPEARKEPKNWPRPVAYFRPNITVEVEVRAGEARGCQWVGIASPLITSEPPRKGSLLGEVEVLCRTGNSLFWEVLFIQEENFYFSLNSLSLRRIGRLQLSGAVKRSEYGIPPEW